MKTHFLLPAALVLVAAPAFCAKTFDKTSEFKDAKTPKGYLNVKFGTYANMEVEPKGTDCDWVMVDTALFDLEDLRKSEVAFFPNPIGLEHGGEASRAFWTSTPLAVSFEAALANQGVALKWVGKLPEPSQMDPYAAAVYGGYRTSAHDRRIANRAPVERPKCPELTGLQATMEADRYNEDKANLGVEVAIQRAEEREAKRQADWAAAQAEAEKPANPETVKGYALVLYLTGSSVNRGAAMWIPYMPVTNTTTAEFILLKDGKPVLAGRHNSVGAYSASAPKCGQALASAFNIKVKKS